MLLTYNLVMLAVDGLILRAMRGGSGLRRWFTLATIFIIAATLLAVATVWLAFGRQRIDLFAVFRLLSAAVFFHGTLLTLGAAWVFRHSWRLGAGINAVLAAGLLTTAYHIWFIEPTWLEVTRVEIASAKIQRPIRIVVIADLQTEDFGEYEQGVLRLAFAERPDVILWAGDYVQSPQADEQYRRINEFLRANPYSPPLGAYAVAGNVDSPRWPKMFEGTDVVVVHQTQAFMLDGVRLTCLSLGDSYNGLCDLLGREIPIHPAAAPADMRRAAGANGPPAADAADRENASSGEPAGDAATAAEPATDIERARDLSATAYHIIVGHVPNFARGRNDGDLLLAGHTHGGQVQIPGVGPLIANCWVPRSWASGITMLEGGRRLIVSRGIGMERGEAPQIRFFCRPQLLVIELLPES